MADTMVHYSDDSLMNFLTKEEMRTKAPYLFNTEPTNPNLTNKYVFANTETIIDDMAKLGWGVVDCKQQRNNPKKPSCKSFHMVVFQNPDIYIEREDADGNKTIDAFPRIIVQNSHDGFKSFKFMCGLYRCVCSNGLIVATEEFENIAIRHINYTFEELRRVVAESIEKIEASLKAMDEMEKITLTNEQKAELVTEALRIRKNDDTIKVDEDTIEDILTPTRKEDEENNLWTIFNVIQEKMMKGNFSLTNTKNPEKVRKARPITGAAKDLEFNQKFFQFANNYCNRLAA